MDTPSSRPALAGRAFGDSLENLYLMVTIYASGMQMAIQRPRYTIKLLFNFTAHFFFKPDAGLTKAITRFPKGFLSIGHPFRPLGTLRVKVPFGFV